MTIKNTRIKPALFSDIVTRSHGLSLDLLPAMITLCRQSEKPKTFQLVKSFEIMSTIIKRIPQANEEKLKDQIEKVSSDFTSCLLEALKVAHESQDKGPFSLPRDRLKTLIKSYSLVVRKVKPLLASMDSLQTTEMIAVLETLRDHEKFKCSSFTSFMNQTIQLLK